jgi:membrane protease subunit HflK
MQNMLDSYGAGVLIKDVKLLDVAPPEPVVDAFNDVQRARADEERKRNEAEAYSKSIIPKARGEAEQIIQQAKGYAAEVTNQAQGEAERFESVLRQYNNSKDITRTRLYIEAMEEVMSVANKTIIGGETAQNVLPYLPLSKGLKGGNN